MVAEEVAGELGWHEAKEGSVDIGSEVWLGSGITIPFRGIDVFFARTAR